MCRSREGAFSRANLLLKGCDVGRPTFSPPSPNASGSRRPIQSASITSVSRAPSGFAGGPRVEGAAGEQRGARMVQANAVSAYFPSF